MNPLDWLRAIFAPYKTSTAAASIATARAVSSGIRATPTGRASVDLPDTIISSSWIIVPPQDYENSWRTMNLDAAHLDVLSPRELLDMLIDLSPEVSRAYWDLLRLCNPGWEVKAFQLGGEDAEHPQAQAALNAFFVVLRDQYGSADVVIGRLFGGAFSRGAFCAEMVLDRRGRLPIDLATPDPYSVRFRKRTDPVRGEVWQPGQWQGGKFVELDIPTFKYLPVDPAPGVPYGRPLAAPALFTTIFLLGLLHDIKRVVMQQGYKRMDISISLEQAIAHYTNDTQGAETLGAFIAAAVADVTAAYAQLEPDDAFVHTDMIVLNPPAGTIDSDSIGALGEIIERLERMATRALKSNSLLMDTDNSASETDSNRRWEIHAAGVKSLQHYCESLLESLLTLALEAQGIQARVQFRFAELRAAEELRDAQTDAMQTANARAKYEAGYISQDEASNAAVGHDADVPEPRGGVGAPQPEMVQDDGDGNEASGGVGGGRMTRLFNQFWREVFDDMLPEIKGIRVKLIPDGADDPLLPIPDEVTISDGDVDRAIAEWDELMPEFAGLLEAAVVGQYNFDVERSPLSWTDKPPSGVARYVWTRASGTPSPWEWSASAHRYRNPADGRFVGQKQMTELRDQFVDAKRVAAQSLAADLGSGSKSLQEFEVAFRREIKTIFLDQYVLGKGGRNAMTQADWGTVGRMLRDQYMFAGDFARDIAAGTLSQAQIAARAAMYVSSSTQAFERGRAASYGDLNLPEHPADGSQKCGSNCRCSWSIKETDDSWECTWKLANAEHCESCRGNAEKWSPLTVPKAGRSREQLETQLEGMTNGHH